VISAIGRRRTFTELRRDGRKVRHGSVRLSFLPLETAAPQVAFAIGRSFGTAVERNRGRRRLRAAFLDAWRDAPADGRAQLQGAFLLTGGRRLLTDPYRQLVADVGRCLDELSTELSTEPSVERRTVETTGRVPA